jgi:hypothetical protein
VIDVQVARELRKAGLVWKPSPGDRFAIPDRDLDDEAFFLSNMTIEVHALPEGRVIGFNGTTEWAMDDVELSEALWLPREDQLRELLGATFVSLQHADLGYSVALSLLGSDLVFTAPSAALAYAAALLHLLGAARS